MGQLPWQDVITEDQIRRLLADYGVQSMQIKYLSRNHNSKNQVYLAGDLSELSVIPMGDVEAISGTSTKKTAGAPIYHASVSWVWINPDGRSPAPSTQLVFYPQYPEVRLSGFLRGSPKAPNEFMSIARRGQEEGRVLIFGTGRDGHVYAVIVSRFSQIGRAHV